MPSRLYDQFGNRTDMRVDARPRNVEYEEGTGPGTGRTARRVDPSVGSSAGNRSANLGGGLDAFYLAQRDKTRSMGDINREATIGREQGLMYNPRLNQYQFNSMYNRNPATNPAMQQQQQAAQTASNLNLPTSGLMGSLGFLPKIAQSAMGNKSTSPIPQNPLLGVREQNIANAKSSGQFDKIRNEYNRKNMGSGISMDASGNISKSPVMAARSAVQSRLREQQQQRIR